MCDFKFKLSPYKFQQNQTLIMEQIAFDSKNLKLLKQNNLQYNPTEEQIFSYAEEVLSLNLQNDTGLIYLAQQALKAPLPPEWEACQYSREQQNSGQDELQSFIVYRNKILKTVTFQHPLDSVYKEKTRQLKLMKNTAKYSQNITPINEEMLESSVVIPNKNNSKNNMRNGIAESLSFENSSSGLFNPKSNDSKTYLNDSKSHANISKNYQARPSSSRNQMKNQLLARNITEQSVVYEDEGFQNISLITDRDYEQYQQQFDNVKQNYGLKDQNKNHQQLVDKNEKRSRFDIERLKKKAKTIKPIIVPMNKNDTNERTEINQKKKKVQQKPISAQKFQQDLKQAMFRKILQTNQSRTQEMTRRIMKQLKLKQIQQRILILKQFSSGYSNCNISKQQITADKREQKLNILKQKERKLKEVEMQNRIVEQQIKQTLKYIQLQRRL